MPLSHYLDQLTRFSDWFIPADIAANREQREKARPDRRPGLAAAQFPHIHRNLTYDLEVDTSRETPESAADLILARLAGGPARP